MDTYYFEFLNLNDIETVIKYSLITKQYYVSSKARIDEGCALRGICKHRNTIEEAIQAFNETISGQTLVINAHSDNRREIKIPKINI